MNVQPDDTVIFGVSDWTNETWWASAISLPVTRDEWHTAVGIFYAGQKIEIWIDGVLANSMPTTLTHARITNQNVNIGNMNWLGDEWAPFVGDIDYVQIYEGVVPEPATLLLLGLGGLLLRRRK